MTVRLETAVQRWVGLSTDTRPDPDRGDNSVSVGSRFEELDTGVVYRWNGERWMVPQQRDAQLIALEAIHQELQAIHALIEELPGMTFSVVVKE